MIAPAHSIKRGVSLYSFQEEYFLRTLSLEQCIATAASMGALGIESIGEQMMPGFPKLGDAFYAGWHGWMRQYGTIPVCHDMFLDTLFYKHRRLTHEECVASVERDLQHAARLGCKVVRMLVSVSPELMESCLPAAEKYDVKMGIEVHAPWDLDHPWFQRHLEMIVRTGTKHAGLIPDMGIFTKRLPRVVRDRALRQGATPKVVEYVCQAYEAGIMREYIVAEARNMGGNPAALAFAESARHNNFSPPRRLTEYCPYMFHLHAKFYEMLEDGTEYSIPYEQIIAALKAGGYQGYLSSEYEGNRHIQDAFPVDSVEQVRRQQAMLARLLGESAASTPQLATH